MSDYTPQGIPRNVSLLNQTVNQVAQARQTEGSKQVQENGKVEKTKNEETKATSSSKSQSKSGMLEDVRLKFKVDPDTNEVTVTILNKSTNEIIRTIPADELKNLREGGLVEYFR